MTSKPSKISPWLPAKWDESHAAAIQALARGDANAFQQQHALKYIVETLAGTYDVSYRAESERDTCFAEGKRHVGLQIVKLSTIDLLTIKGKTHDRNSPSNG